MEAERPVLRQWLDKAKKNWVLLALPGLLVYAFFVRCLHLLDPSSYYIVSMDSYFFHRLAQGIMSGQPLPSYPGANVAYTLHSGIAYPLAYIAKAMSNVFNISSGNALELSSKFLPPVLGVISMVVIYGAATKIFNRQVGFLSAFAWAFMLLAFTIGAAGYLDRDGLSMLLMMIGAFIFFLSKSWHFKVGNRDAGWLVGGLGVLLVEGLLYIEWKAQPVLMLLAVLCVFLVVELLLGYLDARRTEASVVRRFTVALNQVNWRTFVLIVLVNVVVVAIHPHLAISMVQQIDNILHGNWGTGAIEESRLGYMDILSYTFFLVPIAVALCLTFKKRDKGSIFLSCWFLSLLVLSIFGKRFLVYTIPAACVLSGVGLTYIWDWGMKRGDQEDRRVAVVALLGLIVFTSSLGAFGLGRNIILAPDRDWQDAMAYLREQTPPNSVVISQWTWGYWILDLGQRRPVVDDGYYSYDAGRLRDVGLAYSAADPAEAAQIMEKYGAGYLVFSKQDLDKASAIMGWAGLGEGLNTFPENSLIMQSLTGRFEAGNGLQVVFQDSEVVILRLTLDLEHEK